jgi:hypothetical protein
MMKFLMKFFDEIFHTIGGEFLVKVFDDFWKDVGGGGL